jgi:hypothetical protein
MTMVLNDEDIVERATGICIGCRLSATGGGWKGLRGTIEPQIGRPETPEPAARAGSAFE